MERQLTCLLQLGDKRIPEGPSSARALPPSTPSAPRADLVRGGKQDGPSGRDRGRRDQPARSPSMPSGKAPGSQSTSEQTPPVQSLRFRIGMPSDAGQGDRGRDSSMKDDDRDGGRKRTVSGVCCQNRCRQHQLTLHQIVIKTKQTHHPLFL